MLLYFALKIRLTFLSIFCHSCIPSLALKEAVKFQLFSIAFYVSICLLFSLLHLDFLCSSSTLLLFFFLEATLLLALDISCLSDWNSIFISRITIKQVYHNITWLSAGFKHWFSVFQKCSFLVKKCKLVETSKYGFGSFCVILPLNLNV